jgi:hypothetical protein
MSASLKREEKVEVERKLRHFSGRAIGGDKLDKRFDAGAVSIGRSI